MFVESIWIPFFALCLMVKTNQNTKYNSIYIYIDTYTHNTWYLSMSISIYIYIYIYWYLLPKHLATSKKRVPRCPSPAWDVSVTSCGHECSLGARSTMCSLSCLLLVFAMKINISRQTCVSQQTHDISKFNGLNVWGQLTGNHGSPTFLWVSCRLSFQPIRGMVILWLSRTAEINEVQLQNRPQNLVAYCVVCTFKTLQKTIGFLVEFSSLLDVWWMKIEIGTTQCDKSMRTENHLRFQ